MQHLERDREGTGWSCSVAPVCEAVIEEERTTHSVSSPVGFFKKMF